MDQGESVQRPTMPMVPVTEQTGTMSASLQEGLPLAEMPSPPHRSTFVDSIASLKALDVIGHSDRAVGENERQRQHRPRTPAQSVGLPRTWQVGPSLQLQGYGTSTWHADSASPWQEGYHQGSGAQTSMTLSGSILGSLISAFSTLSSPKNSASTSTARATQGSLAQDIGHVKFQVRPDYVAGSTEPTTVVPASLTGAWKVGVLPTGFNVFRGRGLRSLPTIATAPNTAVRPAGTDTVRRSSPQLTPIATAGIEGPPGGSVAAVVHFPDVGTATELASQANTMSERKRGKQRAEPHSPTRRDSAYRHGAQSSHTTQRGTQVQPGRRDPPLRTSKRRVKSQPIREIKRHVAECARNARSTSESRVSIGPRAEDASQGGSEDDSEGDEESSDNDSDGINSDFWNEELTPPSKSGLLVPAGSQFEKHSQEIKRSSWETEVPSSGNDPNPAKADTMAEYRMRPCREAHHDGIQRKSEHGGLRRLMDEDLVKDPTGGWSEAPIPSDPLSTSRQAVLSKLSVRGHSPAASQRTAVHQRAAGPSAEVAYGREIRRQANLIDNERASEETRLFTQQQWLVGRHGRDKVTASNSHTVHETSAAGIDIRDHALRGDTRLWSRASDGAKKENQDPRFLPTSLSTSREPVERTEGLHPEAESLDDNGRSQVDQNADGSRMMYAPRQRRQAFGSEGFATQSSESDGPPDDLLFERSRSMTPQSESGPVADTSQSGGSPTRPPVYYCRSTIERGHGASPVNGRNHSQLATGSGDESVSREGETEMTPAEASPLGPARYPIPISGQQLQHRALPAFHTALHSILQSRSLGSFFSPGSSREGMSNIRRSRQIKRGESALDASAILRGGPQLIPFLSRSHITTDNRRLPVTLTTFPPPDSFKDMTRLNNIGDPRVRTHEEASSVVGLSAESPSRNATRAGVDTEAKGSNNEEANAILHIDQAEGEEDSTIPPLQSLADHVKVPLGRMSGAQQDKSPTASIAGRPSDAQLGGPNCPPKERHARAAGLSRRNIPTERATMDAPFESESTESMPVDKRPRAPRTRDADVDGSVNHRLLRALSWLTACEDDAPQGGSSTDLEAPDEKAGELTESCDCEGIEGQKSNEKQLADRGELPAGTTQTSEELLKKKHESVVETTHDGQEEYLLRPQRERESEASSLPSLGDAPQSAIDMTRTSAEEGRQAVVTTAEAAAKLAALESDERYTPPCSDDDDDDDSTDSDTSIVTVIYRGPACKSPESSQDIVGPTSALAAAVATEAPFQASDSLPLARHGLGLQAQEQQHVSQDLILPEPRVVSAGHKRLYPEEQARRVGRIRKAHRQATMAAPNGMNPGPGAPYAPGGGIFPNAGHHNDVQHIWKLVEELSNALEANRLKYEELQESITQAQIRPQQPPTQPQENGMVNGDNAHGHQAQPQAAAHLSPDATNQIALLTNQLTTSQTHVNDLTTHLAATQTLVSAYESALGETTARLRQYAYENQSHIIALHAHYNALLEQSRNETVQAQLVHQEWQAGLGRLSKGVRQAFDELSTGEMKERSRRKGLKEENRVLRRMAGWEELSDSSESESEDEVDLLRAEAFQGDGGELQDASTAAEGGGEQRGRVGLGFSS